MNLRLYFILFFSILAFAGCYSKRVEKTVVEPKEKVVVREQPEREIAIIEEPEYQKKKRVTVTENY